MDWTGSNGCQNCIALNNKLQLFELLKQKCCKTDDITKHFLALKTSYEKSAKLLESKSKKLLEARSKIKDAAKAEEGFKRKAAEFQIRLVSSDSKYQELFKDIAVEREKNAILLQEKCQLENLLESKENDIAALNVLSKQCEEKFANEVSDLSAKMEKKIDGLKSEIQKLQDLNTKLKANGNQKKRHDKLREDIVDIFKDGLILAGDPLRRFRKLLNRLQENENAAKLESMLDTPSMTPDGTTSSDTGVFSGDEDFGCPSLGNDLEMSSDSDEDFDNVQSDVMVPASPPPTSNLTHFKLSKANSCSLEEPLPTIESHSESNQDTCGANVSTGSVTDDDKTLCSVSIDSSADGFDFNMKLTDTTSSTNDKNFLNDKISVDSSETCKPLSNAEDLLKNLNCESNVNNCNRWKSQPSPSKKLSPVPTSEMSPSISDKPAACLSQAGASDSLFSPPGGDLNPSLKSQARRDNYEISFDVTSAGSYEKSCSALVMSSSQSNNEVLNVSDASEIMAKESDSRLEDISSSSSNEELLDTINSPCLSLVHNAYMKKSQKPLIEKKEDNFGDSADLCRGSDVHKACPIPAASVSVSSISSNDAEQVESNILSDESRQLEESTQNVPETENIQNLSDNSLEETKPLEDEMDLDAMLHEWNPPTPILPFSDDSCGFDVSLSSSDLNQDLPRKTVSVGTNTDIKHYVSTASSPISHLLKENSHASTNGSLKHEKMVKDSFTSPPRSFTCNRSSSPLKIQRRNIGVMPVSELRRSVAVSPMKVAMKNSATSPCRPLFKDVSVSPLRVRKVDSATNPSPCDINTSSDTEKTDKSWSFEAKMLQQTLEVLGLSNGDLSGVVLDQSLVDELRKAIEMALRKTDNNSKRKLQSSKQISTSYCTFDPCEFAEICNQQHYNLHLLAKSKRVEKAMCSREMRRSRNLKRLKGSSRRQKRLSALSFKEEVLEEDNSSQKKKRKLNSLLKESCEEKELTGSMTQQFENSVTNESLNFRPTIPSSTQSPECVKADKPIDWMHCAQPLMSVASPKISESVVPSPTYQSENNTNVININSTGDKTASASCNVKNVTSIAPDIEKNLPPLSSSNKMDEDERRSESNFSDSSEDNLIIDESISCVSPISSEVSICEVSPQETCKEPVLERETNVPNTDSFILPKPIGMSLRKRRQSTCSESSNAESLSGVNDGPVILRRSPRTKKIRLAHVDHVGHQKGSLNSLPCESSVLVQKEQENETLISAKISAASEKLSKFKYTPPKRDYDADSEPSVRPPKRSAENEEISRDVKCSSIAKPSVRTDSLTLSNGLEDSDIDMECDEKITATRETRGRVASGTRKPTKLQRLRSSVSKVHPMVQAAKHTRSPGEVKEQTRDLVNETMERTPEINNYPEPTANSKDESSIIERLRSKGNVRMAAAASGRTAQLIQVKPGARRHQRPAATSSPVHLLKKPVETTARSQPFVRPADRVAALKRNTPSTPTEKSTVSTLSVDTGSTAGSPNLLDSLLNDLSKRGCQSVSVPNDHEQENENVSIEARTSVHLKRGTYESFLISDEDLKISTFSPLVSALIEVETHQPQSSCKTDLMQTQILVISTLKEFIAAPSFTPSVLQKAIDALSSPNLYNILPVLVQKIVKMMDDDFDTSPLRMGNHQSCVPPLTPVQQQLVTLIVQLSSQHEHLQQLPHQVLRLLEYRVFRLGAQPEGDRLVWCSKLYAAICRIYCLRSQALIFCWDSIYTLKTRSYFVVKAVMDVWPHLFPSNPVFEKACPNAQVLIHFMRSYVEDKNGADRNKFDNHYLKRMLRSRTLQSLSTNSSILASTIFSNIISGASDTNVAALILLAKREEENWTLRDIVNQKLFPALHNWCNGSLSNIAGERVIWILCSILRAIPPERNDKVSDTLTKLLISELQKPEGTLPPQMQEVIALGLAMLSRHDIENVAIALASWNPKFGTDRGFSSRLLLYLTSLIKNGVRNLSWWQGLKFSKPGLKG